MMSDIRQNLFFAFLYNALGIPVAAGVLFPIVGVLMSPILAGAAMSFTSVSVIANALRLRAVRLDEEAPHAKGWCVHDKIGGSKSRGLRVRST